MDVGLNNQNTFEIEELKEVVFIVEATSNEIHNLWLEWAKEAIDFSRHKPIQTPVNWGFKVFSDSFKSFLSDDLQNEIIALEALCKETLHRNEESQEDLKNRVEWTPGNGISVPIGHIEGNTFSEFTMKDSGFEKRPIVLNCNIVWINGHKILFYEGCSQLVDHRMIEEWFLKYFQRTHDNYTRWNHSDTTNFHNCIHGLERLDKEPRNTTYQPK